MGLYLSGIHIPVFVLLLCQAIDWKYHNQIIKHTELKLDSRHVQRGPSKKRQKRVTTMSMDSTTDRMETNRIALRKMFKAIAEYGREVRLRRQANGGASIQEPPDGQAAGRESRPTRRRKQRRKKGVA